jgi:hypothetical protein
LPQDFAEKVVLGSRCPHHDATSAWDAIARLRSANVPEALIARMMGQNAADQFAVEIVRQTAVQFTPEKAGLTNGMAGRRRLSGILRAGETIEIVTPGAGGYGPPPERDPARSSAT